jgi:hypothetical protein
LQRNTCITSLSVFMEFLQKSDGNPLFFQFIRTSTSLTRVSLNGNHKCTHLRDLLVASLLLAISSNAGIHEVNLDFPLSAVNLTTFVGNAKALKKLTIGHITADWEKGYIYPSYTSVLPPAFAGAETLQSLTLTRFTTNSKLLPALQGLAAGQSKLREFKLNNFSVGLYTRAMDSWEPICRLFDSHCLEHLEFANVAFETAMMETLVWCFTNNGDPSAVLSKLSFRECNYSEGACAALVTFMQSTTGIREGDMELALKH